MGLLENALSLRTSPQTGVAIPPIFEQLRPKIEGIYFYPGDCHASDVGHRLAMTAFLNSPIFCTPKPSPPGKVDRAQPGTDEGRKTYTFTPPIYTVFSV